MRLNRTSGETPTNSTTATQAVAKPSQQPSQDGIQESFVQSDAVEEREASPRSAEESELLAMFPGIAEGLTTEYLDLGWQLTPASSGHTEFEPSEIDQELVLKWSEAIHLKRRLLDELSGHPNEVARLVEAVLEEEGLLQGFVNEEALGDPEEFVAELNELLGLSVSRAQLWRAGLYEKLKTYSHAYFAHRYALELTEQTKLLLSHGFGELFLDLPVIVKVVETDNNNASHEWVSGLHRLTLVV